MESVTPRRRLIARPIFWTIVAAIGGLTAFAIMFTAVVPLSSDSLRQRMVESLSAKLDSDVELGDIHLHLFPGLRADGSGLTIHRRNANEHQPLISVARFSVNASVVGLMRKHVDRVQLEGLDIEIPPSGNDGNGSGGNHDAAADDGRAPDATPIEDTIVIDTVETTDAKLAIIPQEKNKAARVWAIHHLTMHGLGVTKAMPFEATLTNAVPPGEIDVEGSFGPWRRGDEGKTPLKGDFYFAKADLGVFNGISGTLGSEGYFNGTLEALQVDGQTDVPDFTIKVGGHPFPLHVKYHSLVDGTNGDTRLPQMDAWFLSSYLHASGAVIGAPAGKQGRTVTLDVDLNKARLEDIMTMAVNAPKPPMVGALKLTTKFVLPPGDADVVDRLRLNGRFHIGTARFTNDDVQQKIEGLSKRASAKADQQATPHVSSDFDGRFTLGGGRLALSELTFEIPGAKVELAGDYGLKAQTLDFKGRVLLDAKISQTVTGFKSLLLKAVDPIFRRKDGNNGSTIPIRIGGTRSDPAFGVDLGRVFKRGNEP